MGNEFCLSKRKFKCEHSYLNEMERNQLQKLYDKLKSKLDEQYELSEECLMFLIKNNQGISYKLYQYMQFYNNYDKLNYQAFEEKVITLVKQEANEGMNIIELYSIISVQRINCTKIDYDREKVSYSEVFDLLSEIEFFLWEQGYYIQDYLKQDQATTRSLLNRLFTSAGSISFQQLTQFLQYNFPCLTNLLSNYFYTLFITQKSQLQKSKFSKPSYLMNNSSFGYMSISSTVIQDAENYELLWTSVQDWNFESLYKALISFKGATLVLIKFDDFTDNDSDEEEMQKSKRNTTQPNYCIIGALNATEWIQTNSFQGNSKAMLFQLYPTFTGLNVATDVFKSKRPGSQNYCYLSKDDQKRGLGFGGDLKQFRLWISAQNMQQSSYVAKQGEPYIKGSLLHQSVQTPTITYMEAWGIGGKQQSEIDNDTTSIKQYYENANVLLQKYQAQ